MSDSHRPISFTNVVGQEDTKQLLQIKINAFKKTNDSIGHILFLGPPGTGKTTLSNVVANEMGVTFHSIMGNRIKNWTDLYNIIKNIGTNDVVFIDEIHCLTQKMQEYLYGIMEDFTYTIENKSLARPQMMKCPKFTLVGATTHGGLLNGPFISRFHNVVNLVPYTDAQLSKMVVNSCHRQYNLDIPIEIANTVARLSNKTPRKANLILSNLKEVAEGTIKEKVRSNHLTKGLLQDTLKMMGIDPIIGLDRTQRNYIMTLLRECLPHSNNGENMPPNCKGLGIVPLANMIREQRETVENYIEPVLLSELEFKVPSKGSMHKGPLVKLTKNGRMPTQGAYNYVLTLQNFQAQLNWFENENFTM
jgi:Holliday junction DNA helicase RuvB